MVVSANASSGIEIIGIDPGREKKVTTIYQSVCDSCGSYFSEDRKNPILVSKRVADKLKVHLRSKVVVRFQDENNNLVDAAFRICGIFNTGNGMFDDREIFVRQSDLSAILGKPAPIHEIAIFLSDPSKMNSIRDRIRHEYPKLLTQSWMETQPELALLVNASDQMMYIFLGIILLALAFGIVNTMLMAVLERTKEIGMLMSIGMSKSMVFRMIMLETVLLTLTGGILGMGLSAGLIAIFHRHGIDLSIVGQGLEALGYESMVYPTITLSFFFVLTIMIIITGILSAIYPARKALSIEPARAIKIE
jgi:ABC-type lipoprotein release transport system permease subunit